MRFPWKREPSLAPSRRVSTKQLELETAKEILSEVFHARPADVEEMTLRRLEERTWHDEREDGLWHATFFLGEYSWAGASRVSTLRFAYY